MIKVGFCDAFVWSLNTNEVREVAAMANFNLNKTQSLNGALRVVYMEEEGGDFVALGEGVRNQPYLLFPHTYGLYKQPILMYFEITRAWPNNKVTQHLE